MFHVEHLFIQNVPAAIREKFDNDPYQFYQFVNNPKNVDAVKQMFGNSKNYSVPTADAVEEAQREVVLNSVEDKKE